MDAQKARSKWEALKRMSVERGCSKHEAATARKLADALAKKYGFADVPAGRPFREDFDTRFRRAEGRAAMRFNWEYRQCYKPRCHCMKTNSPHGPYKYGKKREGRTVRSIYLGR